MQQVGNAMNTDISEETLAATVSILGSTRTQLERAVQRVAELCPVTARSPAAALVIHPCGTGVIMRLETSLQVGIGDDTSRANQNVEALLGIPPSTNILGYKLRYQKLFGTDPADLQLYVYKPAQPPHGHQTPAPRAPQGTWALYRMYSQVKERRSLTDSNQTVVIPCP
jgi:hypothetical protein